MKPEVNKFLNYTFFGSSKYEFENEEEIKQAQ